MHRGIWTRLLAVFIAVLIGTSLVVPSPAEAANAACGDTIFADTTLDADLVCSGEALFIGADNITLDLGGHTLTGSGTFQGILLGPGRHGVTIKNGTVSGFGHGVILIGADHNVIETVHTSNSTFNGISLFRDSIGGDGSNFNIVRDCVITGAVNFGVISNGDSNDNTIERCDITGTGGSGIFIGGGGGQSASFRNIVQNNLLHDGTSTAPSISINGGSGNNTITGNQILRNGVGTGAHGINITSGSSSNTVSGNTVADSSGSGLNVSGLVTAGVLTTPSASNQLLINDLRRNNFGIFLGSGAQTNTISGNTVVANRNQGIASTGTVPQPEGNTFSGNTSYGNTTNPPAPTNSFDIRDSTTGTGTAGTRNTYTANRCVLGNPAPLCVSQLSNVTTTSTPTGANALLGASATDVATVSGGSPTPTGTVKFFLCQPAQVTVGGCEGIAGVQVGAPKTLAAGVATSDATTNTTATGKYCWRVEYAGDSVYVPSSHTNATTECFTAAATVQSLTALVNGFVTDASITMNANALLAKLEAAQAGLDKGNKNPAANQLNAFINQVNAQRGNGISPAAADLLIAQVTLVIASLS